MNIIYQNFRLLLLFGTFILIQGCVNLKPVESTSRFYVLGAREHIEAPAQAPNQAGMSIGLRKLRMAAYLDTPYIVLRHGGNEVSFSENHRWGEDLEQAINRAVQTHLSTHDSIQRVDAAPWAMNTRHDYLLQIHILQFEGQTDAPPSADSPRIPEGQNVQVHLVANWQIINPMTNDMIYQEKTDVLLGGWSTEIYPNLVSGLDDTLKTMAEDIARALEKL